MADPDEAVVTDLMLGTMIAFGADIILLLAFLWAAGYVSATLFGAVSVLIVAFYAGWIGWRWRAIGTAESAERSPVEELKRRYANGEISEAEFERRLDTLIEEDDRAQRAREPTERAPERSR